jgi:flagellar assembly protein FliH
MALSKPVLKKELAADVVFDFKAREFPLIISPSASSFVASTAEKVSDFKINPLIAEQAGIAKLQSDALNDKIEEEALQQMKSVQEKAYKEAYELGLAEGREQALAENRHVLISKIESLDKILHALEEMKTRVTADHEAHIIRMIMGLAARIAMREIKTDPASILPVVLQIVADAQSDEMVTIRVAPEDFAFLEKAREKTGKQAEALRRVKFEVADGVASGGCFLESNYGSIDATVETRVQRAWDTLIDRLPKAENRSPSGGGAGESSGT